MAEAPEIVLAPTTIDELPAIAEMEQGIARDFILPYSAERHRQEFAMPAILYRTIHRGEEPIGFLILALDADGVSLELRRIVVSWPGHGYGRKAIGLVDAICSEELGRSRIWLDVFESNQRARHVYDLCGYRQFGASENEGRTLLLLEKAVGVQSG